MYTPINICAVDSDKIKAYYDALIESDTLKFRYPGIINPGWAEILAQVSKMPEHIYLVEDDKGLIVGEFSLEKYSGKASQVHFSTLPSLSFKVRLDMMREVADIVLNEWKDSNGLPFLYTLVGLTPVSNRAACIAVLKSGYKKVGIIPKACYMARHDFYDDVMLSIREVN